MGEVIVTNLMDHNRNEPILGRRGIRAVGPGPRTIKANHRIFHTSDWSIDTDGN